MKELAFHPLTACSSCALRSAAACPMSQAMRGDGVELPKRHLRFDCDTILASPGESSSLAGVVVDGILRSTHITVEGRQEVVSLHKPRSIFGHLFEKFSRYGLEAATAVTLCCFDRSELERRSQINPRISHALLLALTHHLAEVREHARTMGSPRASERIARFILANCDGRSCSPQLAKMPVSRRDMAGLLGTTPETISRFVQTLVRSNIVRLKGARALLVVDLPSLERLAGRPMTESAPHAVSSAEPVYIIPSIIDDNQCVRPQ